MKKALNPKKSGYAFWIHRNNEHYIGTSCFAIRVPEVTDDLRKALAAHKIFEPNTRNTGLVVTDAGSIQVERVLFPQNKPSHQLIETPLLHESEKSQYRIFLYQDGSNVYVDDLYLRAIKQFHSQGIWFSNQHIRGSLYLYAGEDKPVAILLPVILHEKKYEVKVIT